MALVDSSWTAVILGILSAAFGLLARANFGSAKCPKCGQASLDPNGLCIECDKPSWMRFLEEPQRTSIPDFRACPNCGTEMEYHSSPISMGGGGTRYKCRRCGYVR